MIFSPQKKAWLFNNNRKPYYAEDPSPAVDCRGLFIVTGKALVIYSEKLNNENKPNP